MSTAIHERSIPLRDWEVKAILAGRKTQLRRVVSLGHPGTFGPSDTPGYQWHFRGSLRGGTAGSGSGCWQDLGHDDFLALCPFGRVGDRLWVKETFAPRLGIDPVVEPEKARQYAIYRADGTSLRDDLWHAYPDRWTSSASMPRWASRITLEIESVRVERLQEISEADAKAEGLVEWSNPPRIELKHYGLSVADVWETSPVATFRRIWDSDHAGPGTRWEDSPWVWTIGFCRIEEGGEA